MKLTVVTPSYNQGQFIGETINSVLNQGIDNLEYIVMDGGSTDNTVEVLKGFENKIIWESKKDNGQTDAVNQGIIKSTGDIIGWLNSDDIYYPDACRKVLKVFEDHPEVNVVYGNANHIDINGNFMEEYYTEDFNYERLKNICFICQPSLFFRKNIVEKYGYLDDSLHFCMDYDYWIRLGKYEKFYRLNELIAGSRLYEDNKTLGSRLKVHNEIACMFKKNLGKVPSRWIYNLAHVICDEKGLKRDSSEFKKELVKQSKKAFIKYNKYIPLKEWKTLLLWSKQAKEK